MLLHSQTAGARWWIELQWLPLCCKESISLWLARPHREETTSDTEVELELGFVRFPARNSCRSFWFGRQTEIASSLEKESRIPEATAGVEEEEEEDSMWCWCVSVPQAEMTFCISSSKRIASLFFLHKKIKYFHLFLFLTTRCALGNYSTVCWLLSKNQDSPQSTDKSIVKSQFKPRLV